MPKQLSDMSKDGRQQLALALLLLKDFKSEGRCDLDVSLMCLEFADMLGVRKEFEELIPKVPPMRIEPRYK
jgi:hypothetical protein